MEHRVPELDAAEADAVALHDLVARPQPRLPRQPPRLGRLDEDPGLLGRTLGIRSIISNQKMKIKKAILYIHLHLTHFHQLYCFTLICNFHQFKLASHDDDLLRLRRTGGYQCHCQLNCPFPQLWQFTQKVRPGVRTRTGADSGHMSPACKHPHTSQHSALELQTKVRKLREVLQSRRRPLLATTAFSWTNQPKVIRDRQVG